MPTPVRCSRCKKFFVTPELGVAPCPHCKAVNAVPGTASPGQGMDLDAIADRITAPPVEKPLPEPDVRPRRSSRMRDTPFLPFFLIGGGLMFVMLAVAAGLAALIWYESKKVNQVFDEATAADKSKPALTPPSPKRPMDELPKKAPTPPPAPAKPADEPRDKPKPPEKPATNDGAPPDKPKPPEKPETPDKPEKPEKPPEKPEKPEKVPSDWTELGTDNPYPEVLAPSEEVTMEMDGMRINRRHYVKTKATDYLSKSFKFEVVFTLKRGDDAVFIGIGEADRTGEYNEPKNSLFLRINPPTGSKEGSVAIANAPTKDLLELGKLRKEGTHRAVIHKKGDVVTFYIDVDNDGKADDLEKTLTNIAVAGPFLKKTNASLFFGSGGTFQKFKITE